MAQEPVSVKTPRGRVDVNEEYCKGCSLCVAACPKKVLRISERINPKGYRPVEQFEEGCIACGICAMTCPDAVLSVYRLPEGQRGGDDGE